MPYKRYKRRKQKSSFVFNNFIGSIVIILLAGIGYLYFSNNDNKTNFKNNTHINSKTNTANSRTANNKTRTNISDKPHHYNNTNISVTSNDPNTTNTKNDPKNGPKIEINYTQAKKLARQIYAEHRATFYCGCQYDKHGKVNLESCGYQHRENLRRAKRLEWEHIMPAHHFGQHRLCWREPICRKQNGKTYKGRNCCRKVDPTFVKMEADLHNLVPEIGELNGLRSNYRFGVLPYVKPGQFGMCEFKIDEKSRRVEPKADTRGMIARIYLYMANTYQIPLSDSQKKLFEAWNNQYPASSWEKERNEKIYQLQGNRNTFVSR